LIRAKVRFPNRKIEKRELKALNCGPVMDDRLCCADTDTTRHPNM